MKKLGRKFDTTRDTVEAYYISCMCNCIPSCKPVCKSGTLAYTEIKLISSSLLKPSAVRMGGTRVLSGIIAMP